MDYIMLLAATLLVAVDFSLNKVYQKINGASAKSAFGFNALLGLFSALVFFAANGFKLSFSLYSFIMAALMCIFGTTYSILGFKLLKNGSMALYTLFLMTGGMTLPYIFGLIFLNETFSWLRMAGLAIIFAGVIIANFNGEKANAKMILLCVAVFILNGCVSITSKLHQINTVYYSVNTSEFIIFTGIVKFVITSVLFLITKKEPLEQPATMKHKKLISVLVAIASTGISGISSLLQLKGAITIPATVLYPIITGGTIVFSTLAGVIIFKDKLSIKIIISVILCFAGTFMFL